MINSANNISSNKNFKIYENHIRDFLKPNKNKEKEKDRKKNNNKNLYDNISKIHNDKKNIDLNKVSKYFYFWYNKGF